MKKQNFEITLEGNLLTISSSRKNQTEEKNENYTRREFSYKSFQRTFELVKDVVDEEYIDAVEENGVLRFMIPKRQEAAKPTRRLIVIQ
jgi:HSP20 family protein